MRKEQSMNNIDFEKDQTEVLDRTENIKSLANQVKKLRDLEDEVKAEEQERPEWLPEKFKSPEDMAKAYGELEKSFTKSRQEDAPKEAEAEEQPAEEKETLEIKPQEEQAKEVVENAGIDYDALATEYAENNGLTEAN